MTKEKLYEEMKNRIITQKYKPEQVLNEKDLMQTFGVGRTPLREVLFDLQRDGLVSILPRYGTFVTPLSISDLRNLIQLRPTLEELAAEIAFDHISRQQQEEIGDILENSEAMIDAHEKGNLPEDVLNELRNQEARIHLILYAAADNPYLTSVCRQLQANTERYWHFAHMDPNNIVDQLADLRKVYEAIARRDKAACKQLMRQHTMDYIDSVLCYLSLK